ncbi:MULTISPECIES: DUF1493 family protein [Klebsiella]|uniref:DUF1493 family protein n=1 Tax=Klebsiella TaxID=570 RepID=UPI0001B75127|nr:MULTISPECIES: DUF1493 family protein [Klebsiella]EEW42248.1 hypothetical protein HMPREF0484_1693 [Klebsiella pneumoniae subsp. rhinoscleromatis ATCC 13884]EXF38249.1 hypothetical protein N035_021700 [Klebsiella pneumoniae EGD-HP19-C]CCI78316.1 unnamed protein product [Klebsiella pneumoniae subsp. rhinoscleromatis SB3432]HDU4832936.1 DUF1493 family protein [Klebsiella pneumoniae subsp. ozaenae]AWX83836.1 DUF1493 family protein [Klebsiella pneumoniae subsp. pneumoniae]
MDILLMESIQDQVLDLFKDEISTRLDKNWKEIPLELDYDLFDAPGDDLHDALNKFEQKFNVDLSSVKWSCYFPWENTPMLTRWFKVKREDVEKTRKPLTIKMFAESAKAGKWLYD